MSLTQRMLLRIVLTFALVALIKLWGLPGLHSAPPATQGQGCTYECGPGPGGPPPQPAPQGPGLITGFAPSTTPTLAPSSALPPLMLAAPPPQVASPTPFAEATRSPEQICLGPKSNSEASEWIVDPTTKQGHCLVYATCNSTLSFFDFIYCLIWGLSSLCRTAVSL